MGPVTNLPMQWRFWLPVWALAVIMLIVLLLPSSGVAIAQTFDITCEGGIARATPQPAGVTLVCIPYTPTPTSTPAPILTNTPVAPTATKMSPTATSILPTVTPTPTKVPVATATPIAGSSLVAFPGAEGFGAQAKGGRGGTVFEVTTLADSGTGSLRACVIATGPRTCVFRTGGTIELLTTLEVRNPYLTIAGQTAPGDGIQLKVKDLSKSIDLFKISTYEVIVRYMKLRPGTHEANARCMSINAGGTATTDKLARNIMIDHISCSWAGDEILIAWDRTHHVTFQYSIFSEPISPGWKGPNLGKYGGGYYTVWRNLIAHAQFRTPNASGSGGTTEVVNNLIYNFKNFGMRATLGSMTNILSNYIKAGPSTSSGAVYVKNDQDVQDPDSSQPIPNPTTKGFYVLGNLMAPYRGINKIASILPSNVPAAYVKATPYPSSSLPLLAAQEVYEEVLINAGAIHGLNCDGTVYRRPDAVDIRIVESVRNERDSRNVEPPKSTYINDPSEVGGWPTLAAGAACADQDHDGMPDIFELARGFNPASNDSTGDKDGDGYTNLEEYLNGS